MPKLKRSQLQTHLLTSIKIVKPYLDYTAYCYFILATLFFCFSTEASLSYHGRLSLQIPVPPRSVVVGSLQRKNQKSRRDELAEAFLALEDANPLLLKGVLVPAISEQSIPDEVLQEYQEQIDILQQATSVFFSPESFSFAYEYWIEQLATRRTLKRNSGFYTQRSLTRLLVELLKPHDGLSIYDPTVGTGGMLVECARYVQQHGGNPASLQLVGREKAPNIWAICRMNMLAHGLSEAMIEQGDTLQTTQAAPRHFDLVLQDLPTSDSTNRSQMRWSDEAFLRHAISSLTVDGRAAILAPAAVLQQDHQDFWHYVLSRDWLEAVIGLPAHLLHETSAAAYVFVFNKKKPAARRAHVLFVQAVPNFVPRATQNQLRDDDIGRVVQAFDSWSNDRNYARVVPVHQIESQNYRLNVDRYLDWEDPPQHIDMVAALNRYRSAVHKREAAVAQLVKSLELLNFSTGDTESGKAAE